MKKTLSILLALTMLMSTVIITDFSAFATTIKSNDFKIVTENMKRPTVLKKGSTFTLKGNIKANKTIKNFSVTVTDLNSFKTEIKFDKNVKSKSVNISNYKNDYDFSTLPSGDKQLVMTFCDNDGNKAKIKREFTVLGKAKESVHITKKCKITANKGEVKNVTDSSDDTYWSSGKMTIEFPKSKKVDGIFIKWHKSSGNKYTIKSYDKNGKELDKYDNHSYGMLHKYYKMSDGAVKAVINLTKAKDNYGIACLRVYEKGKVGKSVERWQEPKVGECDLMVISSHRDDELLYFGGTIPYYLNAKNKNVYTVYMSGRDRLRVREALAGQWAMGNTTVPIFMNFPGGYHDGINGTLAAWGGENKALGELVERIRRYQPDVIVSHDINGEYGHPSHKTTAYMVEKAVKLAADKTKYKSSYKKYGTWQVKKLYLHLYQKNKIKMNWKKSYPGLDGKTPLQSATVAFDKHISQHERWSMTAKAVTDCPSNEYGLVYSTVGKDKKKNDFFENID